VTCTNDVMFQCFDENGAMIKESEVSQTINCVSTFEENSSSSGHGSVAASQQVESKLQNPPSVWSFEDNMSVLRFKQAISEPKS
jgi:hypothetical protein